MFSAMPSTWKNTMGPTRGATSAAGSASKRSREKSWHEKKELNCLTGAADWGLQLWLPTHHFEINKSSIETTVKTRKEICWTVIAATSEGMITLHFLQNTLLLVLKKFSFSVAQNWYEKSMPIDSNRIWEKVNSLNDNLKQKEGKGSIAWKFNASKGYFDRFKMGFGF